MSNQPLKHVAVKGKKLPLLAFFGVILVCILIDQVTKYWAVNSLKAVGDIPLWEGVLHLTYAENTGMAFSLLSRHTWILTLVTGIFLAAALAALICLRRRLPVFVMTVGAVIVGGGIGNLIDRMTLGHVTDFIYFKIINFAIFNAADSFVVVGCVLLLIYALFSREEPAVKHASAEKKNEDQN